MAGTVLPIPDDAYPVFIDDAHAYVGLPAVAAVRLPAKAVRGEQGFGTDQKRSPADGFVFPLADALERRACGPDGRVPDAAVVYAAATTEYRVVVEALYTLSQLGYSRLFVGTHSNAPGPSRVGLRAPGGGNWALAVVVGRAGFSLSKKPNGEEPAVCLGSNPGTPQPAIPAGASGLDFAALGTCVGAMAPPGSALYLSADGEVPWRVAVLAAEALGKERQVAFAFPTPKDPNWQRGNIKNAAMVVANMRPAFADCYKQALAVLPNAEGKIRLHVRVGEAGTVTSVDANATGVLGTAVECVRAVALAAKFDPPNGGGTAAVVVPISFVRNAGPPAQRPPCQR